MLNSYCHLCFFNSFFDKKCLISCCTTSNQKPLCFIDNSSDELDELFPPRDTPYTDEELKAMEEENEKIMEEWEAYYASGIF